MGGMYYEGQTADDNTVDEEDGDDYLNDFHDETSTDDTETGGVTYDDSSGLVDSNDSGGSSSSGSTSTDSDNSSSSTTSTSTDRGGVYYGDQTTDDNTVDEEDGDDYLNDFHDETTTAPGDEPGGIVYKDDDSDSSSSGSSDSSAGSVETDENLIPPDTNTVNLGDGQQVQLSGLGEDYDQYEIQFPDGSTKTVDGPGYYDIPAANQGGELSTVKVRGIRSDGRASEWTSEEIGDPTDGLAPADGSAPLGGHSGVRAESVRVAGPEDLSGPHYVRPSLKNETGKEKEVTVSFAGESATVTLPPYSTREPTVVVPTPDEADAEDLKYSAELTVDGETREISGINAPGFHERNDFNLGGDWNGVDESPSASDSNVYPAGGSSDSSDGSGGSSSSGSSGSSSSGSPIDWFTPDTTGSSSGSSSGSSGPIPDGIAVPAAIGGVGLLILLAVGMGGVR